MRASATSAFFGSTTCAMSLYTFIARHHRQSERAASETRSTISGTKSGSS